VEYPHRAPGSGEIELEALAIQVAGARPNPSMPRSTMKLM
jgi:hypothetical protein